jgi:2-oxoglutarate ferredoxin oxidoreductase subunit delta
MTKKKPIIEVNQKWCKGCAICVEFCPRHVLEMKGVYPVVVNIDACTACGLCEVLCPDFAIEVIKPEEQAAKESK